MIEFLLGVLALDLVVIGWYLHIAAVDERAKAKWDRQFVENGGIKGPLSQDVE